MGSEAELERISALKLPLFSIVPLQEPEPSGTQTPPLQTSASVPFRWEEEPGKPLPCTALIPLSKSNSARCLDPPPRLFSFTSADAKLSKMPSPTTVLEGPYVGRSVFHSSSFRVRRDRHSFGCGSPESGQLGGMVLGRRGGGYKERGFFAGWRWKNHHKCKRGYSSTSLDLEEAGSGTTEEDNSGGTSVKITRIGRSGSSLSLSPARSRFWASVYEGLKQVMPWKRSKKLKKDGLLI